MNYQILVIKNDYNFATIIKNYLEQSHFSVDISSSAINAAFYIKNKKYSLILLDIDLSDFNGLEILKFLNVNRISLPVIVLSKYSDKNTKLQSFKLGASDYIVKPIDVEELEARILAKLKIFNI